MTVLRPDRSRHNADTALVSMLFHEHGRSMLAFATRLTGDRGQAVDVVQDVLVCALRHSRTWHDSRLEVRGRLFQMIEKMVFATSPDGRVRKAVSAVWPSRACPAGTEAVLSLR